MLNIRQTALYNYLLDRGNQWTLQEQVATELFEWYYYTKDDFHNSNARLIMTKDIRAINESESCPKIIISSPNGIKLATEKEFNRYIKSEYVSVFKKLKRIRQKERKGQLNGQSRLVFKNERDTIESFLKEA